MYGYRYKPGSMVIRLHESMSRDQAIELVRGKRKQQQLRGNSPDAATAELVRLLATGVWEPVLLPPPEKKPGKKR